MPSLSITDEPPYTGEAFYRKAMQTLHRAEVPYLVGGAYALRIYAGIVRDTKDFDVFVRAEHVNRALAAFAEEGFRSELTFPHWLGKAYCGEWFVDLIFRAGNGLFDVDDSWFDRARPETIFGTKVVLVPPEEILVTKAYIQERERFDGADIMHLLRTCAGSIDWPHLLKRFGEDWRLLLSHLITFGFVYPGERDRIPVGVINDLTERLRKETHCPVMDRQLCNGTLISRAQYLPDIERWGYHDARCEHRVHMTAEDIRTWTAAIDPKDRTG